MLRTAAEADNRLLDWNQLNHEHPTVQNLVITQIRRRNKLRETGRFNDRTRRCPFGLRPLLFNERKPTLLTCTDSEGVLYRPQTCFSLSGEHQCWFSHIRPHVSLQVSGFGIVAIGIWTLWDKYHYVALLAHPPGTYAVTTYMLLGTGGLIILVGFLGCCGTWKENRICLMTVTILYVCCQWKNKRVCL